MKKLIAVTALALGMGIFSSTPAFADRYWDGRQWHERRHVIVEREYYHGPRNYHPDRFHPYYTYVEPVYAEPAVVYQPAPVVYQPAPVIYQPAPVASFNFRF